MGRGCSPLAAFLTVILLATGVQAQVTAQQGTDQALESRVKGQFHSPMVLEAPFPATWDGKVYFTKFARFSCDDVLISSISFDAIHKHNSTAELKIEVFLGNTGHEDKWVDLIIELVSGNAILARTVRKEIDAEERKTITRTLRMPITKAILDMNPPPTMRFVVGVRSNS